MSSVLVPKHDETVHCQGCSSPYVVSTSTALQVEAQRTSGTHLPRSLPAPLPNQRDRLRQVEFLGSQFYYVQRRVFMRSESLMQAEAWQLDSLLRCYVQCVRLSGSVSVAFLPEKVRQSSKIQAKEPHWEETSLHTPFRLCRHNVTSLITV